jgi:glycosyltransferase involved in cell wall biosynthesis
MQMTKENSKQLLIDLNCCIIIPTYNNRKTIKKVISDVLEYANNVIVVNDGTTDGTSEIINTFNVKITSIGYPKNVGKGNALKTGFKEALKQGFDYAITIDSDAQHYADDIPKFIEVLQENPHSLLMGSRNMEQEGVPQKSSFGNKFSNFWVKLQTGITLPDTQTGYRLYPLKEVEKLTLFTTKFEFEIEVLVKLAWRNVPVLPVDIKVKYDPDERVTHFRPWQDFTRISVLNTYLTTLTFLWYFHKRQFLKLWHNGIWTTIKNEAIKPQESNLRKSVSIGYGIFMGIMPLFGFQLLIGIPIAIFLKLNKVLSIAVAHISIPPMIPLIIYISYKIGALFIVNSIEFTSWKELTLESIHLNFMQYFIGGWVFAFSASITAFLVSYTVLFFFRKGK